MTLTCALCPQGHAWQCRAKYYQPRCPVTWPWVSAHARSLLLLFAPAPSVMRDTPCHIYFSISFPHNACRNNHLCRAAGGMTELFSPNGCINTIWIDHSPSFSTILVLGLRVEINSTLVNWSPTYWMLIKLIRRLCCQTGGQRSNQRTVRMSCKIIFHHFKLEVRTALQRLIYNRPITQVLHKISNSIWCQCLRKHIFPVYSSTVNTEEQVSNLSFCENSLVISKLWPLIWEKIIFLKIIHSRYS